LIQDQDDWVDQINDALAKITKGMIKPVRITQEQMEQVGVGTDDFNEKQWRRLIRNAYGVAPTAEDPNRYQAQLDNWANENAKLITNIPQKAIDQIREDSIEALTSGTTVDDLKAIIHERIDVADSRAELIARDQVAKLNADLNRERQTDVGVEQYIWRTVGDERVRDSHVDCDGETFSWDNDTSLNGVPKPDGNDPGQDYQCRCWAEPILPSRMSFELELDEAA
jgi:SPP1 gp7 family putative phage head morphogenesis protein